MQTAHGDVFIRGAGVWTTLGRGLERQASALADDPVRPRPLPSRGVNDPGFPYFDLAAPGADPLAAAVDDALAAAALERWQRGRCGVFLGSTCSNLAADEAAYEARMHAPGAWPLDLADGHAGMVQDLAQAAGLGGPHFFFGTACSSSANALLHAARMIRRGALEVALVVGTERFNRLSLHGFDALQLLSRDRPRPFDRDRDGLVLGAGVAALVLARDPAGTPWRVRGGATLADTASPTGSSPATIAAVIERALRAADVTPAAISAVKAHGTATVQNDAAEGAALLQVLGDEPPPVTSLKGALGHTLGACGAVETAAVMACVDHGFWPASAGFRAADSDPPGVVPRTRATALDGGCLLMNAFGFGGNNCAYVIERDHAGH